MTVLHLHIHVDRLTEDTTQAIRLILEGIEAKDAADQIDDDKPDLPPVPLEQPDVPHYPADDGDWEEAF